MQLYDRHKGLIFLENFLKHSSFGGMLIFRTGQSRKKSLQ